MKQKSIKQQKEKKESVESYFFKYAFPCAQVKLRLGSLRKEEHNQLKDLFLENKSPSKEELEKTFTAAFRRLKKLADGMGKEMWDFSVLKKYWEGNHNKVIDEGDGMYGIASESFKDLCKIHLAEIIEKKEDSLIVRYGNKERIVSGFLVPEVDVGDKVRIHFAYAVEKI
jgi:hypothetical protein